jgi:hypothetical protein
LATTVRSVLSPCSFPSQSVLTVGSPFSPLTFQKKLDSADLAMEINL